MRWDLVLVLSLLVAEMMAQGFTDRFYREMGGDGNPYAVQLTDSGFRGRDGNVQPELVSDFSVEFAKDRECHIDVDIEWAAQLGGGVSADAVLIGDFRNDGKKEIAVAMIEDYVEVIEGENGAKEPGWPFYMPDTSFLASPVAYDLVGSSRHDIMVATSSAEILFLREDGLPYHGSTLKIPRLPVLKNWFAGMENMTNLYYGLYNELPSRSERMRDIKDNETTYKDLFKQTMSDRRSQPLRQEMKQEMVKSQETRPTDQGKKRMTDQRLKELQNEAIRLDELERERRERAQTVTQAQGIGNIRNTVVGTFEDQEVEEFQKLVEADEDKLTKRREKKRRKIEEQQQQQQQPQPQPQPQQLTQEAQNVEEAKQRQEALEYVMKEKPELMETIARDRGFNSIEEYIQSAQGKGDMRQQFLTMQDYQKEYDREAKAKYNELAAANKRERDQEKADSDRLNRMRAIDNDADNDRLARLREKQARAREFGGNDAERKTARDQQNESPNEQRRKVFEPVLNAARPDEGARQDSIPRQRESDDPDLDRIERLRRKNMARANDAGDASEQNPAGGELKPDGSNGIPLRPDTVMDDGANNPVADGDMDHSAPQKRQPLALGDDDDLEDERGARMIGNKKKKNAGLTEIGGWLTDAGVESLELFLPAETSTSFVKTLRAGVNPLFSPQYEMYYEMMQNSPIVKSKNHLWVDPHIISEPVVVDMEGDGRNELILAVTYYFQPPEDPRKMADFMSEAEESGYVPSNYLATAIVAVDMTLHQISWISPLELTRFSGKYRAFFHASPVVVDLDGDGNMEIVIGSVSGHIFALDNVGCLLPGFPLVMDSLVAPVVVEDVNGDGELDIIAADDVSTIAVFSRTGEIIWEREYGNYVHAAPIVADLDADGTLDLLFVTRDLIFALDGKKGELLRHFPMRVGKLLKSQPMVMRMKNNRHFHIIVSTGNGHVYLIDCKTGCVETLDLGHRGSGYNGVALDDVNGNGKMDIVVPLGTYLYCLSTDTDYHPFNVWKTVNHESNVPTSYWHQGIRMLESVTQERDIHGSRFQVLFEIVDDRSSNARKKAYYDVSITLKRELDPLYEGRYTSPGVYLVHLDSPHERMDGLLRIEMSNEHRQIYSHEVSVSFHSKFYRSIKWVLLVPFLVSCFVMFYYKEINQGITRIL